MGPAFDVGLRRGFRERDRMVGERLVSGELTLSHVICHSLVLPWNTCPILSLRYTQVPGITPWVALPSDQDLLAQNYKDLCKTVIGLGSLVVEEPWVTPSVNSPHTGLGLTSQVLTNVHTLAVDPTVTPEGSVLSGVRLCWYHGMFFLALHQAPGATLPELLQMKPGAFLHFVKVDYPVLEAHLKAQLHL
jgi:hypothetical protein